MRRLLPVFLLLALTLTLPEPTASAFSVNDAADAYAPFDSEGGSLQFAKILAEAGESTTGRLFAFHVKGCSPETRPDASVTIHAVQDRGLPRGEDYPTYVLVSKGAAGLPELIFRTHAGKRLYMADSFSCQPDTCLLSAQQGYTDICLSDPFGNAAPDLPGLRKDFWSDLIKLFGL
ncbi:hypothetical protein [Roseibium sediminicola]|uniref:Lipoprotein n=1 Tax=Roseibium sediminicola TaxID=2933272 RepID=A0ABT0H1W5_9HYPH|nr:hypothetical protein [Roseibium sp. CAU 1639]MCK7615596.1 hypothetical protein [Roseibium sp. CAU 1639]